MHIIQVAEDFWNIRGSFKIGGLIDIRTHASLVKLGNGEFLFLDSLTLDDEVMAEVLAITGGKDNIKTVLNLHPFHTVHVEWMHKTFPDAVHYGTQRHLDKFPAISWADELIETESAQAKFADDLDFSVPAGVDFISDNPNLHFSSVLAYHPSSKTIHVDDTFMYTKMLGESVSFHLTLAKTLEKRAGAAEDFRAWTKQLIGDWQAAENLCTAHTHTLLGNKNAGDPIAVRIGKALGKVERKLKKHEQKYG